jgi:hypothetical protein
MAVLLCVLIRWWLVSAGPACCSRCAMCMQVGVCMGPGTAGADCTVVWLAGWRSWLRAPAPWDGMAAVCPTHAVLEAQVDWCYAGCWPRF